MGTPAATTPAATTGAVRGNTTAAAVPTLQTTAAGSNQNGGTGFPAKSMFKPFAKIPGGPSSAPNPPSAIGVEISGNTFYAVTARFPPDASKTAQVGLLFGEIGKTPNYVDLTGTPADSSAPGKWFGNDVAVNAQKGLAY